MATDSSDGETDPTTRRERAVEACKRGAKNGISAVRDRRRRVRRRLEEMFNRKVMTSVLVGGAMSKMVERGFVRFLAPDRAVDIVLFGAWTASFVLFVLVSIYWERLAKAASEAADAAEEAAEGATDD